jgi:hypothetical protein
MKYDIDKFLDVNSKSHKAWTTFIFFLIDMKVMAKIPWPQLYYRGQNTLVVNVT